MTTLPFTKSTGRSPLRRGLLLIPLAFVCFALAPAARAVSPAPDGGYPGGNTAEGLDALLNLTTGVDNTAIGRQALLNNDGGNDNTGTGFQALRNNTGNQNTATGSQALFNNAIGNSNTANGREALFHNTEGSGNTAVGFDALFHSKTGSNNIALGTNAGFLLDTGDNNIDIGNLAGGPDESDAIRIGSTQIATFIAGISGATVVSGAAVMVSSDGHLGTITGLSSKRFKAEIKPMDKASEAILALKPVTFRYKQELDPKGIPQFGLVAEEVEKVNPDLVTRDAKGEVYTVRYEAVNAMLLNEFLKAHRKMQEQETTIAQLKDGVKALTASLKEQASQIQKVSAQLEAGKPAPQMVVNDQ